jgi:hypothetical protein
MQNESVKFCLMIVTTDGWYPALNATPATVSCKLVSELENIVQVLRPGYGKYYLTHVARCDNNLHPFEQDEVVLERYRDNLIRRVPKLERET